MVKLSVMQRLESRWIHSDGGGDIDTLKSAGAGVCGHSEEGYRGLGHTRGYGRPRGEGPLPDVNF